MPGVMFICWGVCDTLVHVHKKGIYFLFLCCCLVVDLVIHLCYFDSCLLCCRSVTRVWQVWCASISVEGGVGLCHGASGSNWPRDTLSQLLSLWTEASVMSLPPLWTDLQVCHISVFVDCVLWRDGRCGVFGMCFGEED